MNLKESYRYANYLDRLLDTAYIYLRNKGFVTTTQQNHMRSKMNSEAKDEVIEVQKPYDVEFTPMNVVDFTVKILAEKEKLADAIVDAKSGTEINIDNAVAMNKKKQSFINALNNIADIKATERTTNGKDYKFDINGEQKPYIYEILETTTINFDRKDIKALIKKFSKECDDVSSKLDSIEINTEIEFNPSWDVNDKFEDIVVG